MMHLSLATLFCLVPSFLAVLIKLIQHGNSFFPFDDANPCFWPDGDVSCIDGDVSVFVGLRSSLLVIRNGIVEERFYKENDDIPLPKPDSLIVITTEKDDKDHGVREHVEFLNLVHQKPVFSSLTGNTHRISLSKLRPISDEKRIPENTKMLILDVGGIQHYCKKILKGSKSMAFEER